MTIRIELGPEQQAALNTFRRQVTEMWDKLVAALQPWIASIGEAFAQVAKAYTAYQAHIDAGRAAQLAMRHHTRQLYGRRHR